MELRSSGKQCELCTLLAAVHCPADEANLCWRCDAHVHAANFLVARHWRLLFCSSCGALTGTVSTGSRIEPKLLCCPNCCTGESYGDDEALKVVASPSRDNSVVSSCQSESSRSSGSLSVKRPRNEFKQVGSARWSCKNLGRRRPTPKLASKVDTGDEASCESNVLHQSTSTTAPNTDRRASLDPVADTEEASGGVFSANTSTSNGSLCEGRWYRKRRSYRRITRKSARAHVNQ